MHHTSRTTRTTLFIALVICLLFLAVGCAPTDTGTPQGESGPNMANIYTERFETGYGAVVLGLWGQFPYPVPEPVKIELPDTCPKARVTVDTFGPWIVETIDSTGNWVFFDKLSNNDAVSLHTCNETGAITERIYYIRIDPRADARRQGQYFDIFVGNEF